VLMHELGHAYIFDVVYQGDHIAYEQMYNYYYKVEFLGNAENSPWERFGNDLQSMCENRGC